MDSAAAAAATATTRAADVCDMAFFAAFPSCLSNLHTHDALKLPSTR